MYLFGLLSMLFFSHLHVYDLCLLCHTDQDVFFTNVCIIFIHCAIHFVKSQYKNYPNKKLFSYLNHAKKLRKTNDIQKICDVVKLSDVTNLAVQNS